VHVAKQPSSSEVKAAVKRASDRQARLSLVANILRGPGRERYDYFISNGFPKWKGTEYYYSRYRPGFGTVLAGVFFFAGGAAHYLALYMSWRRQREFVERYIRYARNAAWGPDNLGVNIPGVEAAPAPPAPAPAPPAQQQMYEDGNGRAVPMNRKMRRMQERDAKKEADKERVAQGGRRGRKGAAPATSASGSGTATPQQQPIGAGPTGSKKRVVAENGKVLVVDSLGDVYLEQEDEEGKIQEFLLDVSLASASDEMYEYANASHSPTNLGVRRSATLLSLDCPSGSTSRRSVGYCLSATMMTSRMRSSRTSRRWMTRMTRSRASGRPAPTRPRTLSCLTSLLRSWIRIRRRRAVLARSRASRATSGKERRGENVTTFDACLSEPIDTVWRGFAWMDRYERQKLLYYIHLLTWLRRGRFH
jgi:hypothetical protein